MTEKEKSFEEYFEEATEEKSVADDGTEPEPTEPDQTDDQDDESVVDGEVDVQKDNDPDSGNEDISDDSDTQDDSGDDGPVDWKTQFEKIQQENHKLNHKMSSWEGRIKKANERAEAAEAELKKLEQKDVQPKETKDSDDSPLDDDEKVLKEFADEFPDLVKPLTIMAKKYATSIAEEKIGKVIPTVETLQQEQQKSAREVFLTPIYEAHPDWETIYNSGDLQTWIDKKSQLQQKVLNETVQSGSQEELIEMFDSYKRENNISNSKQTKPTGGSDPKVHDIVAVPGKSGGPPKDRPSMDDFDSAWKEATSKK